MFCAGGMALLILPATACCWPFGGMCCAAKHWLVPLCRLRYHVGGSADLVQGSPLAEIGTA